MWVRERKGVGEKQKGREMLPLYVFFHVAALPWGMERGLRTLESSRVCLNGEGNSFAARLRSRDLLLHLSKIYINARQIRNMTSCYSNAAAAQSHGVMRRHASALNLCASLSYRWQVMRCVYEVRISFQGCVTCLWYRAVYFTVFLLG